MTTTELKSPAMIAEKEGLLERGLHAAEAAMHNVVNSEVTVLRDASEHILEAGGEAGSSTSATFSVSCSRWHKCRTCRSPSRRR